MSDKIKAGIIGATGYAGAELVRMLLSHPRVEITALSSVSFEGKGISDVYPNLNEICPMILDSADDVIEKCDVVFASLPHGLSEEIAEKCINNCAVLIDLGADFRLDDCEVYEKWYGKTYKYPDLHKLSVYALPEYNREEIVSADIIGNPGCYPTSVTLGLMPALKNRLVYFDGIIIDSKSGITGAGRSLSQNTHFPEANEAFSAYKAGSHRHTPEIEQTLSYIADEDIKVTFVPHLLPVNRGIESSIYCRIRDGITFDDICYVYDDAYATEQFVRVIHDGTYANIKNVRYSNYCDISLHIDEHTDTLIVCSVIDNMVKGAAGQAIQNMNIRFGFEENTGLTFVPPAF